MVPILFDPYAADLAQRLASVHPHRVLEVAAGSGALTRAISAALPHAEIIATDLNQAMLDVAARRHLPRRARCMAPGQCVKPPLPRSDL
ncbi:class I SAM-dependent methyltransferase [Rhizobium grahamii]|uniref:Methyltransferase type 11 n=1 Tax=Rhizobium grahamii CCGE 502 TaxID=990285 RepID=S3HZ29_9HYPH|nr:class I SAM-dependent methyltransferase [Rhizobium grahamii]EPE98291.1 methyltransferase type 11 [Rhizobium grahamii CCGE 502]